MTHRYTILNVAYPLAPVGPDAVGGAEQILGALDAALVRAGHRSIVVACGGSAVHGELVSIPRFRGPLTEEVRSRAWHDQRCAIRNILRERPVDLIHFHGLDFNHYLPGDGPPALVTLHLPPEWYEAEAFRLERPQTYFVCVSKDQRSRCPDSARLLPEIPNGVDVRRLTAHHARRGFAVALGRICPEKGFHFALDAARLAGMPLLLGGEVFRYPAHEAYYQSEIVPRLDAQRRHLGPVGFARKRRLLSAAQCVVIPSLAPETSSLVAMEALACGTPVVAFPVGALPEIVEEGKTGFLVQGVEEMAEAMKKAAGLSHEDCRRAARSRFSLERMTQQYLDLYHELIPRGKTHHGCLD